MLKLLKPARPEDLFIQRYDLLMQWALSLTGNNRAQAEDLVHDAFIQFTVRRSELGAIENTDAYLHRVLRNMHLSQVRRATLTEDSRFSIANFDSAEIGLRLVDPREHVDIQDELRQICQYACARKETSKAGSVLILRFFHGYYPSEIAQVMHTNRTAVDWWVQQSRREAKVYLRDPDSLRFVDDKPSETKRFGYARSTGELLAELRTTIFEARKGVCLSSDQLKQIYRSKTQETVSSVVLSHLVSCPDCLDTVNRLLGLPLLAERQSDDRLGRDVPPDSRGGGEGGGPGASIADSEKRYKRRLKETIEHRPQELRIAVNGFVLGAQQVSSEISKQVLTVNVDEPIGFIEVFSEQGLRLLFFDVDQPIDGSIEQVARAEFDCGRSLDLSLNFRGPWPTINVSYRDPTFDAVESYGEESVSEVRADVPFYETSVNEPGSSKLLRSLRRRNLDWRILLRPAPITALVSILLLVAVVLLYRQSPPPPISAAELLQRATAYEDMIAANRDQAQHRTLRLEEKSSAGQLLSSRRVEVWHSADKGVTARRLYDENGSLVAGEWRRADGVQTIYHHGKRPQLQLSPAQRVNTPINFDSVWRIDPTAKEFAALIGDAQNAQAQETANAFVINADGGNRESAGLVRASLVLGRADLHAVEQTLVVRQGEEVREYRFTETSFERRSLSSVAPAVFEPEPALLGSSALESDKAKSVVAADAASSTAAPFLATPELELQVLKQLNQADALYGEQISLTRTPEGRLRVQGIVETDTRKTEILQSLTPVRRNPAVQFQVETVAEAADRQARQRAASNSPTEIGTVEVEAESAIPAAVELRAYLSKQRGFSGGALDEEMRRFADRVMARTRQARRHALALNQIAQRFSADDLQALDADSRNQWRAMISQHARNIQQELEALRRELQPAFPSVAGDEGDAGIEITKDADFARAGKRLYELASTVDEAIGRSFSISSGGNVTAPVRTNQFSRSVRSAMSLAAKIGRQ
ncbi:MAG TPA: sigma-70 family RNA polymerase sigma factor [Pyrinomonadaceae bacterium]|nr:sigma-70 family RNA polymerase sigma factor [Pyrinomonadaceae bacterium]